MVFHSFCQAFKIYHKSIYDFHLYLNLNIEISKKYYPIKIWNMPEK